MYKLWKVRVSGIIKESIVDGVGIRYVIFFQGCPHNCKGCQNPQTHSFDKGTFVNINDIIREINSNPLLDGVTFSGGEALCYPKQCAIIASAVKKQNKTVWLYSGYTFEQILRYPKKKRALELVDVLVDGKYIEEQRDLDLRFKGSSNQRIIDVQKSLKQGKIVLWSEENGN